MNINQILINKYNQAVPRYTSYPPANFFTDSFSEKDYVQLIENSNNENPQNISIYIHIPFCEQICTYCGCNSIPEKRNSTIENYINSVKKEIEIVTKRIHKTRKISQIHYGGGTPNAIDIKYLKEINQLLLSKFSTIEKPEIAIECHPGILKEKDIVKLIDAGFNRFSLGIQDFNEHVLKNVNRKSSAIPVNELVKQLRSYQQITGINMDFIYGLPNQTKQSFTQTIKKAIEIQPNRLVTFSYAHVPWVKKHQQKLSKIGLPTPNEKTDMFLSAYNLLKQNGYMPIGFDHYAQPTDELSIALKNNQLHRNFQGYTTLRTTGQVFAFGVSGISQLSSGYAQNTKDLNKYIEFIASKKLPIEKGLKLNAEQKQIGNVISSIMCNLYINWENKSHEMGVDIDNLKNKVRYDKNKLKHFEADGLINFTDKEIKITEKGSFFIRNIASAFDPMLTENNNIYSKSI